MNVDLRKLVSLPCTIFLAGGVLFAQSHPMANTGGAGGGASPNYSDANRGSADAEDMQTSRDRDFMKKTLEEGLALAKLGELAQQNSQSDDVKQFAQKTADDHMQLDSQMEPIAKQLGVAPPKDLSHRDKKLIAKLEGLNGPTFDEEYISAMVKVHQDDLKEFNNEAGKTQNLPLRDTVKDNTAVILQHLQALETIAQNHHVTAH